MSKANAALSGTESKIQPMVHRLAYLQGFGNTLSSEALQGALPMRQNNPQKPAYGLYTELISGTTFLAPRESNRRVHTYRIRPSVDHAPFKRIDNRLLQSGPFAEALIPNQLRWDPFHIPDTPADFLDGLATIGGNGAVTQQVGMAVHVYRANRSMQDRAFVNADGELLIVPQQGRIRAVTELGLLDVAPNEILLIPRGIRFAIECLDGTARGFVCENYGLPLRLPELGPIGSHGLANPGDFQAPVAWFQNVTKPCQLVQKYGGNLWATELQYSPFNVVAWRGTHVPYKYDTANFVTIGSVSVDHPDPSIFTVLTSPGDAVGGSNVDFIIFPPRWSVSEDTFRPPSFHRNVMCEFMGLIHGTHYSRSHGFEPGGALLHNCWTAHGPDVTTYEQARAADLKPQKLDGHLAFMFESRYPMHLTRFGLESPELQKEVHKQWQGFKTYFDDSRNPA